MRLIGILAGACALGVLSLTGCGEKPATDTAAGGAAAPATDGTTPAGDTATPTPAPAKAVMGGDSPEDVVKRLKAAVEKGDFGAVMNLIDPTERTGMVAMMGLMPQMMRMMKPMLAMMAGMAGGMAGAMGDEKEAAKAKAEAEAKQKKMMADLDAVILEMDNCCKKHNVNLPSMEELGVNPMGGKMDPDELAKKVGDKVANVDAGAFVTDMMGAFEKFKKVMPEGKGGGGGPFDDMKARIGEGKLTDLKVEGDHATGKVDGEPAQFVQVDGRWYAKGLASDASGEGDEGDEGMEEMPEDDEGMGEEKDG